MTNTEIKKFINKEFKGYLSRGFEVQKNILFKRTGNCCSSVLLNLLLSKA